MKCWNLAATLLVVLLASPLRSDSTPADPVKVPFDLLITKHMVVSIKVNGQGPFKVIFDTGAPVSLLSNKIGKKAGLTGKNGAMSGFSLFGPVAQTKVKKLEIGDLKADYVPVIVMDHPTVEVLADALKEPIEGIIGFPFFARYRMTLDYQAKELTFVPTNFEPDPEWFLTRVGRTAPCAAARAALGPLVRHWDRVAAEIQGRRAPTAPALDRFWQSLTGRPSGSRSARGSSTG